MCRILLMDDNLFFRQSLHDLLHIRFPRADIQDAANSKECLEKMRSFGPHIAFIDVEPYGDNGFDLVERIRKSYPSVAVIVLTDFDMDEYRIAALLAGANNVIPKDLWTGKEIIALTETLMATLGIHEFENNLEKLPAKPSWGQPLDRRQRDRKGKNMEREYLKHHPDRRHG
jgi:DNA-binding NarL/FixJ family response regulator